MVNFAIIGCGKIGVRHINFLKNIDGIRILAVTDVIPERAREAAEAANAVAYTDYKSLLTDKNIDVINICTPTGLHAQMAVDALNAGKHVICEKPMALYVADANKMIEAAKKNRKHLFIVKQNRFNAPIKAVREAINKNLLGKIYTISANVIWNRRPDYFTEEPWRGTRDLDGGALATQASHFLDVMQWLGGPISSVFAKQETLLHNIETEDTGALILKFDSGALGTMYYTICAYNKNIEGSLTILGSKGSVKIGGEYLNKIEHWNVEGYPLPQNSEELSPANEYGSYRGSASKHDFVFREAIKKIIGDENTSHVDGEEAKKSVELIEAARISSQTGKEIFLPLQSEKESNSKILDIKEIKQSQSDIINKESIDTNYSDYLNVVNRYLKERSGN